MPLQPEIHHTEWRCNEEKILTAAELRAEARQLGYIRGIASSEPKSYSFCGTVNRMKNEYCRGCSRQRDAGADAIRRGRTIGELEFKYVDDGREFWRYW
jgi:hypothetical protein